MSIIRRRFLVCITIALKDIRSFDSSVDGRFCAGVDDFDSFGIGLVALTSGFFFSTTFGIDAVFFFVIDCSSITFEDLSFFICSLFVFKTGFFVCWTGGVWFTFDLRLIGFDFSSLSSASNILLSNTNSFFAFDFEGGSDSESDVLIVKF